MGNHLDEPHRLAKCVTGFRSYSKRSSISGHRLWRRIVCGCRETVGAAYIAYSQNGTNWHLLPYQYVQLLSVSFGNGLFVTGGSLGTLVVLPMVFSGNNVSPWEASLLLRDYLRPKHLRSCRSASHPTNWTGLVLQSEPVLRLSLSLGNSAALSLNGPSGWRCAIQAVDQIQSTNVWRLLDTVSLTNTPTTWLDVTATNGHSAFTEGFAAAVISRD